jgi:TRAP-type C4-dicarboxylate transport system permease small subunit
MHEGGGAPHAAQGPKGLLRRATEVWALLGGLLLLVIALMISYSSAAGWLIGKPLPGDVELVEMLTAVSVFMFLPYCQISGANVTADIFTARAGPRTVAILDLLAALVALAFGLFLLWRMYYGLLDYRQYVETTTILKIPIWVAYLPALASLALLAAAAAASVRAALGRVSQRR